jgi:hypothetical protein
MEMGKRFSDASLGKIASLETRLNGVLKPVAPRKEFVHGLSRSIQSGNHPTFVDKVTNWHLYALMAAAVVAGGVFVGVLVKTIAETTMNKRSA